MPEYADYLCLVQELRDTLHEHGGSRLVWGDKKRLPVRKKSKTKRKSAKKSRPVRSAAQRPLDTLRGMLLAGTPAVLKESSPSNDRLATLREFVDAAVAYRKVDPEMDFAEHPNVRLAWRRAKQATRLLMLEIANRDPTERDIEDIWRLELYPVD